MPKRARVAGCRPSCGAQQQALGMQPQHLLAARRIDGDRGERVGTFERRRLQSGICADDPREPGCTQQRQRDQRAAGCHESAHASSRHRCLVRASRTPWALICPIREPYVKAIIYHNPRCSKSRQTLALLESHGVEVDVIEYLKNPPDAPTLWALTRALGLAPRDIVRRGEAAFAELDLDAKLADDEALIAAIVAHPVLLERPIVVVGAQAAIGRPPENVLPLLTGRAG